MKIYAIGDIHGMHFKLERLLDRIPFRPDEDTLVFLGDYVDRGPDSRAVVDRVLNLMDQGINVVCLRGNHELMMAHYLEGRDVNFFLLNGGATTVHSYKVGNNGRCRVPDRHVEFLQTLKRFHETDDYLFVHAGFRPGVPLEDQRDEDIYWIRNDFILSDHDFGRKVVFGHTPFREPYVDARKIGIDTGAVYGNKLTCVCLPDEVFYSV
ncbi:MAG: serine/threonine protein phosphatase [Desulfacinum sp.]|jgi:serine/threonine protein phosphatase 1|nr:serine/threonine protein phosphatase [Desulfacinum sp.]MBZ4659837.1 metallophosphoesterase [Desulfacinum sp.]